MTKTKLKSKMFNVEIAQKSPQIKHHNKINNMMYKVLNNW